MHALSASELLRVWERGLRAGPVRRALELLESSSPGIADPEQLSIGQRDALLLHLRERTFGRELTGTSQCSGCEEQIELKFAATDLGTRQVDTGPITVQIREWEVVARPVNSGDLQAVTERDLAQARRRLAERCLLSATFRGHAASACELPDEVSNEVERRLAEADPQADIQLVMDCPACGRTNRVTFDIVPFFWREIENWAARMLREIHTLASAYHWSEEEILALSPTRRQCYLDLLGA